MVFTVKAALIGACVAGLAAVGRGQSADEWGAAVDGVQMSLAVTQTPAPFLPDQLPSFVVRLRNLGTRPIMFNYEAVAYGDLEIDGVWYGEIFVGSCCSAPKTVAPGAQSDGLVLRRGQSEFYAAGPPPTSFIPKPGQHSIRLRTTSSKFYEVRTTARRKLELVSNTVTVTLPSLSAEEERRVLVAHATRRDSYGIPAAQRLVEKYPDGALDAIAEAIAVSRDPILRSEFVRVAGTLPDDRPVAFLLGQLAPSAGVLSQVRAAEALNSRGRTDWLPAIVDAWRAMQRPLIDIDDINMAGTLIRFLSQSANPDAIDALRADAPAPVDTRLAIVQVFLPPGGNGDTTSAKSLSLGGEYRSDLATLPDGPAGAAIDRLLASALDDTGQRVGLKGTYHGIQYVDPRVCDMAAFVYATRWPQKYHFTWPSGRAARDAQIAAIRRARLALQWP